MLQAAVSETSLAAVQPTKHHPPAYPIPPHTHFSVKTPPEPALQTRAASSTPFLGRGESSPKVVGDAVFGFELRSAGASVGSGGRASASSCCATTLPSLKPPICVCARDTNIVLLVFQRCETPQCDWRNSILLSDVCFEHLKLAPISDSEATFSPPVPKGLPKSPCFHC